MTIFLLLTLLAASPASELAPIEADYKAHIAFLADDLLEGRETSFRGQKMAALYLATHMKLSGVKPLGSAKGESYMQPFDVEVLMHREDRLRVSVSGYGPKAELTLHEDFGLYTFGEGRLSLNTDMVYVGYGVESPALSDFRGVDMEGKWVVMHADAPDAEFAADHPFAKLEPRQFSNYYKIMNARNQGAVGVVLLENPKEDEVPAGRPPMHSVYLPNSDGYRSETFPIMRVGQPQRAKLFGPKYAAKLEAAHAKILAKGEPTPLVMKRRRLAWEQVVDRETRGTENVVGVVRGTDPKLRDEYVVLSAHYDHLGFDRDVVYNGADDNGTGCATLLMLGEHYAATPSGRSLIIVFFTGEEQGLLGSEYFVNNLPVPLEQIVANVNIDMIGRNATDSIGVIPSASEGVSSLNLLLNEAHRANDRGFTFDKTLDRYHRRSDQLQFANKKIPNVFFFADVHDHYHSHMDDWELLDYNKLSRFYLLLRDFHDRLLTDPKRPHYVELEALNADAAGAENE